MDIRDIKDAKVTHAGVLQHNADGTTDLQKITQAGLVARSPEGTAAKGMNIRGNEDLWVEIQANTFRNWVNEHLRDANMQVTRSRDDSHRTSLTVSLALGFGLDQRLLRRHEPLRAGRESAEASAEGMEPAPGQPAPLPGERDARAEGRRGGRNQTGEHR